MSKKNHLQDENEMPPMPLKTRDKYGKKIEELPFDNGKTSVLIESFNERNKVMEFCKNNFKYRKFTNRTVDGKLRLYRLS